MTDHFYDALAPYYKYIYQDWEASVARQAQILDGIIKDFCRIPAKNVLDAACGIGTQCIGLARLGYAVSASDISAGEVDKAREEAVRNGLAIDFRVADMRQVGQVFAGSFDVVLACDNSVPHLLSDTEILSAFNQFYVCLKPGGMCLVSVRDYDQMERQDGEKMFPRTIHALEAGKLVMFDVWNFSGDQYEITTYVIEDLGGDQAVTRVLRGGRYYCVGIDTLERLFKEAGFSEVSTIRERYFQPLLVALK